MDDNSSEINLNRIKDLIKNQDVEIVQLIHEKFKTAIKEQKNKETFSNLASLKQSFEIAKDKSNDLIFFLEDDYLHRPGWCDVLLEGFTIDTSYVTLYDFDFFISKGFLSEIFLTKSTHWRATPATTNTYACRYKTLLEDLDVHKKYSSEKAIKEKDGFHFSKDYDKFWELKDHERFLISSIPGWSTHCDFNHLSPIIDWKQVMNSSYGGNKQKQSVSLMYK